MSNDLGLGGLAKSVPATKATKPKAAKAKATKKSADRKPAKPAVKRVADKRGLCPQCGKRDARVISLLKHGDHGWHERSKCNACGKFFVFKAGAVKPEPMKDSK